jgi:hypothetical protein
MNASARNKIALAVGAAGILAAVVTATTTPALGITTATTFAPIVSAKKNGPIALNNSNQTLVTMTVPAGKWLVTGKMWADSVASTPTTNTVVGCSIFKGSAFLDNSAFNTPKVGGAGGTSAGVNVVTAVITLSAKATISFRCDDFGSQAFAHSVVLTAIG